MTDTNLTRVQILLEPEQIEQLRQISANGGASMSWLVRDAVRVYLAQRRLVDARVVWLAADEDEGDEN